SVRGPEGLGSAHLDHDVHRLRDDDVLASSEARRHALPTQPSRLHRAIAIDEGHVHVRNAVDVPRFDLRDHGLLLTEHPRSVPTQASTRERRPSPYGPGGTRASL